MLLMSGSQSCWVLVGSVEVAMSSKPDYHHLELGCRDEEHPDEPLTEIYCGSCTAAAEDNSEDVYFRIPLGSLRAICPRCGDKDLVVNVVDNYLRCHNSARLSHQQQAQLSELWIKLTERVLDRVTGREEEA